MRKILAQIYVQFFGNFTKLYGLSYHVSNSACQEPARVQFNSTLERKEKNKGIKRLMVRKWINNTLKSNSVRNHMHY